MMWTYDENIVKGLGESRIQDLPSYMALERAKGIANHLVSEEGVIDPSKVTYLIEALSKELSSDNQEEVIEKYLFQIRALQKLEKNRELLKLFYELNPPYREAGSEKIVRLSLSLESNKPLKKKDAVQAALSAWLTPLRQHVGSCFATAPAILIQEENPIQLIKDLKDLLETGRLTRIVGGVEHLVPLSLSIGSGNLREPFFLSQPSFKTSKTILKDPGIKASLSVMGCRQIDLNGLKDLVSNLDTILATTLRKEMNLSEEDIHQFQERNLSQPFPSLLIRPASGGMGSKVNDYLDRLERGRLAYILITTHPLLRSWEYTIASFAETKGHFAKWNLYGSLGLGGHEKDGIGETALRVIQDQLDRSNRKVSELQKECEFSYEQLALVEGRLKLNQSEQEFKWIKADYQSKKNAFYALQDLRDKERHKANRLASLFPQLVDCWIELFPRYFQEVYDPDLQEVEQQPFDDAPAGFRLFYKHGRNSISTWSKITNGQEFGEFLASFFQMTERELPENVLEGLEREIGDVITAICLEVRSKNFIEKSVERVSKNHQGAKKPWAFTSGGTMAGLIQHYFGLEESPVSKERWVENPEELLVFLVDEVKKLPRRQQELFDENPEISFLMHSPTHAFRFLPGLSPFKEAWKNDQFTYTWVRDYLIDPQKKFYRNLSLDREGFEKMKDLIASLLPLHLSERFKSHLQLSTPWISSIQFSELVIEALQKEHISHLFEKETLDSFLFENLPLASLNQLKDLFSYFSLKEPQELKRNMTRSETRQLLRKYLIGKKYSQRELKELEISKAMRLLEIEPPPPIVFGDTNWEGGYFAFQVGPISLDLELWKTSKSGTKGVPMSSWRGWLDGSHREATWGIFHKKEQYS